MHEPDRALLSARATLLSASCEELYRSPDVRPLGSWVDDSITSRREQITDDCRLRRVQMTWDEVPVAKLDMTKS